MTDVAWDGEGVLDRMPMFAEAELADGPVAEAQHGDLPVAEGVSAEAPETQGTVDLGRRQAALVALGSLIVAYGVALGSMYAIGSIVHAIDPSRRLDILYVFHNRIAVLVLIGLAVLWLLPPYPSAIRKVEMRTSDRSHTPGSTESDSEPHVGAIARSEGSGESSGSDEGKGGMPTERT